MINIDGFILQCKVLCTGYNSEQEELSEMNPVDVWLDMAIDLSIVDAIKVNGKQDNKIVDKSNCSVIYTAGGVYVIDALYEELLPHWKAARKIQHFMSRVN
jgi:hypothetical protein